MKMKRVLVVGGFEAGSHWAHAINTIKMAQGFARSGYEVTILCRRAGERKHRWEHLNREYGINERIRWIQLPRKILFKNTREHWLFSLMVLIIAFRLKPDLVYARNYIFPWLSCKAGIVTVAECHAHPDNRTSEFMRLVKASQQSSFKLWVTISDVLRDHYASIGVPEEKIIVLPDAVDLELFLRPPLLPESPYDVNAVNIVYVGHLYDYKGIPAILATAKLLPDYYFHLVGGWKEDIRRHKNWVQTNQVSNVIFHGMKPHAEIPGYLWHADVLLLTPSANHPSAQWTSPVKMGEYLASSVPVVATSIPALLDWLSDKEVCFVEPDNAGAMAAGILRILDNPDYGKSLAESGLELAKTLTYGNRVKKILEAIDK